MNAWFSGITAVFMILGSVLINVTNGQHHEMFKSHSPNHSGPPLNFIFKGSLELLSGIQGPSQDDDEDATWPDCPHENDLAKSYKIVGGQEVESSLKYPWMAKVHHESWFCSGSIISKTKILTAHHCVTQSGTNSLEEVSLVPTSQFSVSVGSVDLKGSSHTFGVASIITPPRGAKGDFAVLVLNASLPTCNPTIKPICMSTTPSEDLSPGSIATTMGWGKTQVDQQGPLSPKLKEATISILSDGECQSDDASAEFFCANYGNGVICGGDSGGPVVALKNGKYTQIGVNSYMITPKNIDGCETMFKMGFSSTTTSSFINAAKPFFAC